MEITGKIVFDASPALLNTANRLADAIAGKSVEPQTMTPVNMPPLQETPAAGQLPSVPSASPEPAQAAPAAKPAGVQEMPVKAATHTQKVTLEQLRAVISLKSKSGKREKVKEIISSLGSNSATNMDPACYDEAYEKISAL